MDAPRRGATANVLYGVLHARKVTFASHISTLTLTFIVEAVGQDKSVRTHGGVPGRIVLLSGGTMIIF